MARLYPPVPSVRARGAILRLMMGNSILVVAVLACSGPQPLSLAIRPDDERTYLYYLNQENLNGRTAYLKWMAAEQSTTVSKIESADTTLSTTRNPFDAYSDFNAVSRGAVIYKFHCARCHGEDARGRGPSALPDHPANDFHGFAQRFASTIHRGAPRRWFRSISDGFGDVIAYPDGRSQAMPPFKDKLTREQIWLVITYLQSLDAHVRAEPTADDLENSP